MKKAFSIIILMTVLLTACTPTFPTPSDSSVEENMMSQQTNSTADSLSTSSIITNSQMIKTKQILDKSSTEDYKKLIQKSYSEQELIDLLSYCETDNFNTMLYYLNDFFPIECIRSFTESCTYCIYKLKEGGLLYVFFHGDYTGDPQKRETLLFTNYIFVVKESLTKNDFKKIKVGSRLKDVEAVDSGTKTINSINNQYLTSKVTYHLVKDGFVKIKYETETPKDLDSFKVASVEFFSELETRDMYADKWKFKLLPQDYIH